MAPIRIQIDLAREEPAAIIADLARQMGWEVLSGPSDGRPPDILVAGPERLVGHDYFRNRLDAHPQVLLLASPEEVDARDLLGVFVTGFLDPGLDRDRLREKLDEAAKTHSRTREDFSMWHQMEERYAEASVLLDLALELGPELKIEEVLERIVTHIAEDLGYEIVSIMLLEENGRNLSIQAARGLSQKIIETSKMEIGRGVSGTVALHGEPLLVRDVETDERFSKVQSHGRYSSKSLICVPLKVGDRVIGVLNANNKRRSGPLNEFDLHILSVFAAHVSVNIERARLYHNLARKAAELEDAYGKLKVIDQVKSDFIINVSHEYRTPVTIILGYLELLKSALEDPSHLEKVGVAMEAAHRLSNLIDDSTDLLRLDTGSAPYVFRESQIHYFLEEAVRGQLPRFGLKGVDLILDLPDQLPNVWVDNDKMIKAFDKLLDNALKFTPKGGFVRIRARSYSDGGVVVSVEDSGPGVSREDAGRIFDRFEQGGDIMTEKPEGTGLGLPIVRSIVVGHRGTIEVDGSYTQGCRILVTLPPLRSWGNAAVGKPGSGVGRPEGGSV